MDFVHCNRCYKRNPPDGYLIASCFHIFCLNCGAIDNTKCPICSKAVKIVRLDGNISTGVKMYFAEPIKTMTDNLAKLQRKIEFQENIRVHLLKHLIKEKEKKRQMEVYFRKKGQEFESQKKKLSEATAWIQMAEKQIQASEEERLRTQREIKELQMKLKSLTTSVPTDTLCLNSSAPFSFMLDDAQGVRSAASIANSSPNSTFNLVSPLVNSPAPSLNSSNYHAFFENGGNVLPRTEGFNEETMFNTMSSGQGANANTSDSSAFSVAFNNMFTPSRNMNITNHLIENQTAVNQKMLDKTSMSLDNWRTKSNSFGTHNISERETSLPPANIISSARPHPFHPNSRNAPTSQHRRSIGLDRQQMRDMRRISSQPGYLAQRKSISNRSTFMEKDD